MKIICIGRNYAKHVEELNNKQENNPIIFIKPDSALIKNEMPFVIPEFSTNIQHEIEIVIKINKVGKYIEPNFAPNYYNDLTVGIDFTARDIQEKLKEKGLPWEIAKGFDGSAILGKFVNKSEFSDLQNLNFHLEKNKNIVQIGKTNQMLHTINEIIAYASKFFTLKIGDLIFTGTPAGVGKVNSKDRLEGFLENKSLFKVNVL